KIAGSCCDHASRGSSYLPSARHQGLPPRHPLIPLAPRAPGATSPLSRENEADMRSLSRNLTVGGVAMALLVPIGFAAVAPSAAAAPVRSLLSAGKTAKA